MMIRIHDVTHGLEYKVDFRTARYPIRACVQCCKERATSGHPCRTCGQTETSEVLLELPDNFALVSCGLTVGYGEFDVLPTALAHLVATGQATLVPRKAMGHGGCQSRCVLRGDDYCQW